MLRHYKEQDLYSAGTYHEAFAMLPKGTVENLLKPENKEMLTKILTYHVLSGKYNAKQIWAAVKAGNGTSMMKTVEGEGVTFWTKARIFT